MTEKADNGTTRRAERPGGKSDREARLKSALKANMAKRKAQARKRAAQIETGRGTDRGLGCHARFSAGEKRRGQGIGQDRRYGQRPAAGADPHRRREERLPHLDARNASVRRAADADQRAAPVGYPDHVDAPAVAGRGGVLAQRGAGSGAVVPRARQSHRRLRHRAQDARLDPRARADAGARGAGDRVASRRVRHRRAPRGPASEGAGGHGRGAGAARRLCPCRGAWWPEGCRGRVSDRLGRGHRERADGRDAGQGDDGPEEPRARTRDRRSGALPSGDGRADRGGRHRPDHRRGRRPPAWRDASRCDRPDRAGHLHAGAGDRGRIGGASGAGASIWSAPSSKSSGRRA